MNLEFAKEVKAGLSANPKHLSSKWFYDKRGDELFVKIMNMPEYYLTDSEFEIFSTQTDKIVRALKGESSRMAIYELGAGDGTKTIELLKALNPNHFTYYPIDISQNALDNLNRRLEHELPKIEVKPLHGEYFKVLGNLGENKETNKVILFLGSNLGNMHDDIAKDFVSQLAESMESGDKLLMGLDKIKPEHIVLPAYNDKQGYTREFNLNLLHRINRELNGNFDVSSFEHKPKYDEQTGIASSVLVSTKNQQVRIESLELTVDFTEGEPIHTEVSRKYDRSILDKVIEGSGLSVLHEFNDSRNYFMDVVLIKH